ncbi:N(4)-acetylcytidine aminohydrolase [Shewanella sp. 6_MG-2023]|uniref:N(4)-acetylcytidine aminohydrolase n=1 Tax=Shewanella sp. 6_MG-2023 TaxID=3062660 RepID=UPI0026E4880E|nr:N(4)-acetylcytidine aminohydrolase [Shewanella sp. 6_MG-2023]MDO6621170.1 N(4)-acetylcytidine aminohydrolase [Shewanella sp. 6_MG-2023]
MPALNSITFFSRFETDILSGAKTITLRDDSESHFIAGETLTVSTFEEDKWFCDIKVISVNTVPFTQLTDLHAQQENMPLAVLKTLIQEVYPGIEQLYEIKFKVVTP